jgi:hypothetical protein
MLSNLKRDARGGKWIPTPFGRYRVAEVEEGQRGHFGAYGLQ